MKTLDQEFSSNLDQLQKLQQKFKECLDDLSELPDDLDNPTGQEDADGLLLFEVQLYAITSSLNATAKAMMVSHKVQKIVDEQEKQKQDEYEPGFRDMFQEAGHSHADF